MRTVANGNGQRKNLKLHGFSGPIVQACAMSAQLRAAGAHFCADSLLAVQFPIRNGIVGEFFTTCEDKSKLFSIGPGV